MFNKGQLAGLMKQAQAMQENMKKAQDELVNVEVTGEAGSGMVKITMTAKHQVKRVEIDASVIVVDEKDMLEDLIAAALNDATKKAEEASDARMKQVGVPNMNLPGGMKLPF